MKRAITVPPAARAALAVALKEESPHAAALPDPLPMGRVLRIVDKEIDSEDELKVLAGQDAAGYFLDCYCVIDDRDGQTFWHGRIRENGTTQRLENYEGEWGRPSFPDDPDKTKAEHARIDAHNERVREILRAKGFK
jgi:hypothetical protein